MSAKQITYENIDPKVRSMTMVGLTLAMLIACLDGTIVSTCGATVASELNGTAPYGREPVFLAVLALFIVGSLLADMPASMKMMIACRTPNGLGGAFDHSVIDEAEDIILSSPTA